MGAVSSPKSHGDTDLEQIARITDAATMLSAARELRVADAISAAKDELSSAVLEANDFGVSWQRVGEVLGIARGNAYQRFRRRPGPRTTGTPPYISPAL